MSVVYGVPVSFGSYMFPAEGVTEFRDNFKDMRLTTVQVAGADGAFPADALYGGTAALGSVQIGFRLHGRAADMDGFRDEVAAMASWGLQRLVYRPAQPGAKPRHCLARIHNITDAQNAGDQTEVLQKVQVWFQVPHPRWLENNYAGLALVDAAQMTFTEGASIAFSDGAYGVAISGAETSFTVPYVGNAPALPQVMIEASTLLGQVTIERLKDDTNLVLDRIRLNINSGDKVVIDGAQGRFERDGWPVDFNSLVSPVLYSTPDFIRLEPGASSFRVQCSSGGSAAATMTMWFHDEYR